MIRTSNDRVWIKFPDLDGFYEMSAGFSHLKEICKTVFLETPRLQSSLCAREILYHIGQMLYALELNGVPIITDTLYQRAVDDADMNLTAKSKKILDTVYESYRIVIHGKKLK